MIGHSVRAPRSLLVAAVVTLAGCTPDLCSSAKCADGGGGGASSATDAGSTSSGDAGCDPRALAPSEPIAPSCGIFVQPLATGGDGTQAAPFGSLAEALAQNPLGRPIYVCATGAALEESVHLVNAERLFGGLDCTSWALTALVRTTLQAKADTFAIHLDHTQAAEVFGFRVLAAPATSFDPATGEGRSSVAILSESATATLSNVEVIALDGGPGRSGAPAAGQAAGRQSDASMFDGNDGSGCGDPGGAEKVAACGGQPSTGGQGGTGKVSTGNGGDDGTPGFGGGSPNGHGGAGDDGSQGWLCSTDGGNGGDGHDGPAGQPGLGGDGPGSIDASGYHGTPGLAGTDGGTAQGGGGGGGKKGNGSNGCASAGPAGGGGGAGGCGGLAGEGGGAGGASIALLSLDSTLTLVGVLLRAGDGGDGGDGAPGQLGGNGGNGGDQGNGMACGGGSGGDGGDGGGGGGGRGGPSLGLAFTGVAPAIDAASVTLGGAGAGGSGAPNAGALGISVMQQQF